MINNIELLQNTATFFVIGMLLHLVADWLLQNNYLALNKCNIKHPAAWIHSGIHLVFFALVFPWWVALIVAGTHIFIDTRIPLKWWNKIITAPTTGEMCAHVAIWRDQILHFIIIFGVAFLMALQVKGD